MRTLDPMRQLLRNRPLAALIGAGAVSGIGDWIYMTALPVLVYARTGDAALVALATLGRLVPFFVLSMPAGIAADRFPRRVILVLTETVRCVAMLLIAGLCLVGADVGVVIALTMLAAAAGTISMPALASLTPELAADDAELGRANAIRATLDSLACVVGPAVAGVLILVGGLPFAFALNGLSFATVAIALIAWRSPARSRTDLPVDGP
jgi:MFS family permease